MSLQAARKKQATTAVMTTYTALHIWCALASVRENHARAAHASARGESAVLHHTNISEIARTRVVIVHDELQIVRVAVSVLQKRHVAAGALERRFSDGFGELCCCDAGDFFALLKQTVESVSHRDRRIVSERHIQLHFRTGTDGVATTVLRSSLLCRLLKINATTPTVLDTVLSPDVSPRGVDGIAAGRS